jgi:hypothetical protein
LKGMLAAAALLLPIAEFRPTADGWSLWIDGAPAFLRGAGAPAERLSELRRAGANATRTWGLAEDARPLLDEAARQGMKVIAGVWMQKEGDGGFSYADSIRVAAQEEELLGRPVVVGSYPFYWKSSSTQTSSMPSTHLKTREKLGIADETIRLWSGREPHNRASAILGSTRRKCVWSTTSQIEARP